MKNAIVFGAGMSGIGAKELLEREGYRVFLVDDKSAMTSAEAMEILEHEEIELLIKSPGIPWEAELLLKAQEKDIRIMSEIDIAYRYMDRNIKVISVTGTNGKTTTATKIYEMLHFAGKRVRLAGNAGFSFAGLVASGEPFDYIVLELSSYQLERDPDIHSHIAGIINLTPDHLSRYASVEDYYVTKFNIFLRQEEGDFAIINLDDGMFHEICAKKEISQMIKSQKIYFSRRKRGTVFVHEGSIYCMKDMGERIELNLDAPLEEVAVRISKISELSLKGDHNLENMLFLICAGKILKITDKVISDFLKETRPLEHRLEDFFRKGNTLFINDSKGTNVESTIKAIEVFHNPILLICGGDDKKISNAELVGRIKERVEHVYLIGENSPLLKDDMEKAGYKNYTDLQTLESVISYLKENVDFTRDQTVLFSPATSSFCQFKNFEHRGRVFKELVFNILGKDSDR